MNWFIAFQIVTTWHFRFFFWYSYFFIIRTVWMCHGCLTLPAIFLFNLSMFRLFHCHWLKCVTIRTELCDLGILTVYYLIHSFWLPLMIFFIKPRRGIGFLRPVQSVPITNKVVSTIEPRSWRGVLDTTLCDKVWQWLARSVVFSASLHQ
jgi:hypothetical protein